MFVERHRHLEHHALCQVRDRGLKADGAVVNGLCTRGEGLQVGEILGVGKTEGRGEEIRHTKNTTGWTPVEQRRGAV